MAFNHIPYVTVSITIIKADGLKVNGEIITVYPLKYTTQFKILCQKSADFQLILRVVS
jgi:hypothetical protein